MTLQLPIKRIGIVGGGQLARMLASPCATLQVPLTVLDPMAGSPAGLVATSEQIGSLHDPRALQALVDAVDVVSFDLENVGADTLSALADAGASILPHPDVLRLIQNKWDQKQHYLKHGILTSACRRVDGSWASVEAFGVPCVQKAEVGGYDGRGVAIIENEADWQHRLPGDTFVEAYVANAIELGVMVCCRASGELVTYDPVEMVVDPELHLLKYLLAPARIAPDVAQQARALAAQTVASFNSPGLYGVELFLTVDGTLWVNEVAPRAHNSGHHTIEACVTSQFENQLRALLDLPLGSTTLRRSAVMLNLVGAPGYVGSPVIDGLVPLLSEPDVHVHLYGKQECRPGRKMGHITVLGDSTEELVAIAEDIAATVVIRGENRQ